MRTETNQLYGVVFDSDDKQAQLVLLKREKGRLLEARNSTVPPDHYVKNILLSRNRTYFLGTTFIDRQKTVFCKESLDAGRTWTDNGSLPQGLNTNVDSFYPIIVSDDLYVLTTEMDNSAMEDDQKPDPLKTASVQLLAYKGHRQWKAYEILAYGGRSNLDRNLDNGWASWYDGILHAVWIARNTESKGWSDALYYSRSEDTGRTWSTPVILAEQTAKWSSGDKRCAIAANGTGVHVCWADYRHEKRSGWAKTAEFITNHRWGVAEFFLRIINPFGAGWESASNYEIYYRRSTDNGKTWEPDIKLSEDITFSYFPAVAAEDSHISIVWSGSKVKEKYHYYLDPNDLWMRESFDGAKTWGSCSIVDNAAKDGCTIHKPQIVLLNGKRHLLYIRGKPNPKPTGPGLYSLRQPSFDVVYRESLD